MRIVRFKAIEINNKKYEERNGGFVYGYLVDKNHIGDKSIYFEIDPETLGQFTGLQDIEGYDIYEGDIVYLETVNKQASVTFEEEYACFCFRYDKGSVDYNTYSVSKENIEYLKIKVIGNIHESRK